MFNRKNEALSFGEMKVLRSKHEAVNEELYILLADCDELATRKELVERYGYKSNVTFYSDGTIFVDGKGRGVTGWVGVTPPLRELPPT